MLGQLMKGRYFPVVSCRSYLFPYPVVAVNLRSLAPYPPLSGLVGLVLVPHTCAPDGRKSRTDLSSFLTRVIVHAVSGAFDETYPRAVDETYPRSP